MKKKFLISFGILWILQSILGGIIHAIVAFFTKEKLEKWKSKSKNYFKSGIAYLKNLD